MSIIILLFKLAFFKRATFRKISGGILETLYLVLYTKYKMTNIKFIFYFAHVRGLKNLTVENKHKGVGLMSILNKIENKKENER